MLPSVSYPPFLAQALPAFQVLWEWSIGQAAQEFGLTKAVSESRHRNPLPHHTLQEVSEGFRAIVRGGDDRSPETTLVGELPEALSGQDPHRLLTWDAKMKRLVDGLDWKKGPVDRMIVPTSLSLFEANLLWTEGNLRAATLSFATAARTSALLFHNSPYLRGLSARTHLIAGAAYLFLEDVGRAELFQCFRFFQGAEEFYRHALEKPPAELSSQNARPHDRMATLLSERGDHVGAHEYSRQAYRLRGVAPKPLPKATGRYRTSKKESPA